MFVWSVWLGPRDVVRENASEDEVLRSEGRHLLRNEPEAAVVAASAREGDDRLSDLLGDLRQALLFGLVVCLAAAALFIAAARTVGTDESSRAERAREAGEP